MILAIPVADTVSEPAVLNHPALGRLLFFDPTDPFTPPGHLPDDEQGSYALVLAGASGDLVRVPVAPPEANRVKMDITATLTDAGSLQADVAVDAMGEAATRFRSLYGYMQNDRFQSMLERWVAGGAREATMKQVQPQDDFTADQFSLKMNIDGTRYAQVMQRRMMVFRPTVLPRVFSTFQLQSEERVHPVVLSPECFHQQVRVKLPAGFVVDESPQAAQLATSFGKFTASYKVDGDNLLFTEDLDVSAATLPASSYAEVKSFFQHVAGAEQAPFLLVKN